VNNTSVCEGMKENGGFGVYVPQDQKPVGVLYSVGDDWKMLNVQ